MMQKSSDHVIVWKNQWWRLAILKISPTLKQYKQF